MTEDARSFREEWETDRLRREEAARRILEVSAELHLTWREFEQILDQVKGNGKYLYQRHEGTGQAVCRQSDRRQRLRERSTS